MNKLVFRRGAVSNIINITRNIIISIADMMLWLSLLPIALLLQARMSQ